MKTHRNFALVVAVLVFLMPLSVAAGSLILYAAGSLKAAKLLDAFRGEAPADRDALYRCVIGAGQIGLDWDVVSEIDINPVLVSADGRVKAVDALIVLNPDV